MKKDGKSDMCKTVIAAAVGITRLLAAVFQPFMPSTSRNILDQLKISWNEGIALRDGNVKDILDICSFVPSGHVIGEPKLLFQAIEQKDIDEYRNK